MGGKHRQAQRTKNNARPSSSGRSAELLAASSAHQFSAGAVREIRFIPPALSLMKTDDFDQLLSPDFHIVLKKMNKKDSTTKLKALQEFSDLISRSSDIEPVKAVLTFWATMFGMLVVDMDHRVREATHNAHYQVIAKDKKLIAPLLKQLIGPWFTSQYDNYPPAASAAAKSFGAAFPPDKVQDCVVYCQKEILQYISENLSSKMEARTKHLEANDELEARYERVIITSLQGYCLYLSTLNQEQMLKCLELNQSIISDPKFLKYSSHKSIAIQASWFKLLATLYHKTPFLLNNDQDSKIAQIVFANLDESEPALAGFVWESAVLIMDQGKEWWKHINIEKTYVPKLKRVLRDGGHGNATVIYPNMLSLLHRLPSSLRQSLQFYDSFFDSIVLGLKQKNVLSSKSESGAIVTALIECLQYVILTNRSRVDLCEKLIRSHLLGLIKLAFTEDHICYKVVFQKLCILIHYWHSNTSYENYLQYLNVFWGELCDLVSNLRYYDEDNFSERLVQFFSSLKHHEIVKPRRKSIKVKFEGSAEVALPSDEECDSSGVVDQSYNDNTKKLSYSTIKSLVSCAEEKNRPSLLTHVMAILQTFESRDFLADLNKSLGGSGENLIEIYNGTISKWLRSDCLDCETAVDIVFIFFKYLDADGKDVVLNSFLEVKDDCLGWCIKNSFSHPHNEDSTIQEWLNNERVCEYLIELTEKNLIEDPPPDLKVLFRMAFAENQNEDLIIDVTTVSKIIEKICAPLSKPKSLPPTIMDHCVRLASFVSEIIYSESRLLRYGPELLLSLFKCSATLSSDGVASGDDEDNGEILTNDTAWELTTTWQDAVTVLANFLPKDEFFELTSKFSAIVEEQFKTNFPSSMQVGTYSELIIGYLRAIYNGGQTMMISRVFDIFFDKDFVRPWKEVFASISQHAAYLTSRICCLNAKDVDVKDEQNESEVILQYYAWIWLKIEVLSAFLQDDGNLDRDYGDCDDDVEENKEMNFVAEVLDEGHVTIGNLLPDLACERIFLENYGMTVFFEKVQRYHDKSLERIKFILECSDIKQTLPNRLLETIDSKSNGLKNDYDLNLWCASHNLLQTKLMPAPMSEKSYQSTMYTGGLTLSNLHLIQMLDKTLVSKEVPWKNAVCNDNLILETLQDNPEEHLVDTFAKITRFRTENAGEFLLDNGFNSQNIETVIQTIRLFSRLVECQFQWFQRKHWDFMVISLTSWLANLIHWQKQKNDPHWQASAVAICHLYSILNLKIEQLRSECNENSNVEEWDDLFLPSIHSSLVELLMSLADHFSWMSTISLKHQVMLQQLRTTIDHLHHDLVFTKDNNSSQLHWSTIVKRCTSLVIHRNPILQLWGYQIVMKLVPGLIEADLQADLSETPNSKGFTVQQFREIFKQTDEIVNNILNGFKLGEESCQVEAFTDSCTYTLGYLFLWDIFFTMCEQSPPQLRYMYADWLKNESLLKGLLDNIFKLMPAEVLQYNEGKSKSYLKMFSTEPSLYLTEPSNCDKVEQMACWIYARSVAQVPVLVRQWWTETDSRVSQIVDKVTSLFVSSMLCNQELQDVAHQEKKFKNMTVKVVPSVREVIAVYTVDEAQMELVITLPQNYPLGGPEVRCSRQIGGPSHKQWLMQLKKCLLHQNGRVWDGLSLWNNNLDKKFDGVEECYICFAVLHPGTYQLPKLSCQTCKKKFHSPCLYKWFSTSNKSSCPICRNLF